MSFEEYVYKRRGRTTPIRGGGLACEMPLPRPAHSFTPEDVCLCPQLSSVHPTEIVEQMYHFRLLIFPS